MILKVKGRDGRESLPRPHPWRNESLRGKAGRREQEDWKYLGGNALLTKVREAIRQGKFKQDSPYLRLFSLLL